MKKSTQGENNFLFLYNEHTHTHTHTKQKNQKNIRFEQFLIHSHLPLHSSFRDTFVYEK